MDFDNVVTYICIYIYIYIYNKAGKLNGEKLPFNIIHNYTCR